MTAQTGANTVIGLKLCTLANFGTASVCTTGDKLEVESFTQGENPTELTSGAIGSGLTMASDVQQGAKSPTVGFEANIRYNDAHAVAEAVFFGGASVVAQQSGTLGYAHSFINNETNNTAFVTVAAQFGGGSAMEFPSVAPTKLSYVYAEPPNHGKLTFEGLANARKLTGTTNTQSSLETCTAADADRTIVKDTDEFRINVATDAILSTSYKIGIKSITIDLMKEQEHAREIRGVAGNGIPTPSGSPPFAGEITIELKQLDDVTFFTGAAAGTEYKAELVITGALISGSVYKQRKHLFPRLKVIADPEYNLSSPGYNPLVVKFKCLVATSIPVGMADRYPHQVLINTRSTSYLV